MQHDEHVRTYLESIKKWYEIVWRHPVLGCLEIIHQDDAYLER